MNKLIILINLSGSYQGGAQKRYLNLFNELQKARNDYYLLINKALFNSCMENGIVSSQKNIIVTSIPFEKIKYKLKSQNTSENKPNEIPFAKKNNQPKFKFIGRLKYKIKLFASWILFCFKLSKIIRNYNIKMSYGIFTGGIWSWVVLKLKGVKFIYSYNDASISMVSSKLTDFLSSEYWALRKADKIDFLSEEISMKLSNLFFIPQEKQLITPNSFIDYKKFYPIYPKKQQIVFMSRMDVDIYGNSLKNPELLVEALYILKNKITSEIHTKFVGTGVLLEKLMKKVNEYKLNNVSFIGLTSTPEDILRSSSIYLSLQADNNYPSQSLIEAMACGNAIIATDVGETRKLVTENEGILINPNATELASAIHRLLEDKDLCSKLGRNAAEKVVKEHTLENYINYFTKITATE